MSEVRSFMVVLIFTLVFNAVILYYAGETNYKIICGNSEFDDSYTLENYSIPSENLTLELGHEDIINKAINSDCKHLPFWVWVINIGCIVVLFFWIRKFIGFS